MHTYNIYQSTYNRFYANVCYVCICSVLLVQGNIVFCVLKHHLGPVFLKGSNHVVLMLALQLVFSYI